MDFKRLIDISYALREKTITGRTWHISFITNKSRILSIGVNNLSKTHPINKKYGYKPYQKLHGEMVAALRLGLTSCSGLSITNIRIDRNGQLCNSKFCEGCSNLVKSLNFKSAYYTNEFGQFQQFLY